MRLKKQYFRGEKVAIKKSHGGVVVIGNSVAIKLDANDKINLMYSNYINIISNYSNLHSVFSKCTLCKDGLYSFLLMDRGNHVDASEIDNAALEIYNKIKFEAPPLRNGNIVKSTYIGRGLDIILNYFGPVRHEYIKELVSEYFFDGFKLGLVHGDFHSRNFIKNKLGNFELIDLDCISYDGLKEFDALYFIVESYSVKNNISWIMSLKKIINLEIDDYHKNLFLRFGIKLDKLFLYGFFLNRIGQDLVLNNFSYSKSELGLLVNCPMLVKC
jgi:hypothetical protein